MPDDDQLSPVQRDDLLTAISYALRFDARGKSHNQSRELMANVTAEHLVRQLEMSGFVVMRKPPSAPPRAG